MRTFNISINLTDEAVEFLKNADWDADVNVDPTKDDNAVGLLRNNGLINRVSEDYVSLTHSGILIWKQLF